MPRRTRDRLRLANAQGVTQLRRGDVGEAEQKSFVRALAIVDQGGLSSTQLFASRAYLGIAESALLAGRRGASPALCATRAGNERGARRSRDRWSRRCSCWPARMRDSKDHADAAARTLEVALQPDRTGADRRTRRREACHVSRDTARGVRPSSPRLLIADAQGDESTRGRSLRPSEGGRAACVSRRPRPSKAGSMRSLRIPASTRYPGAGAQSRRALCRRTREGGPPGLRRSGLEVLPTSAPPGRNRLDVLRLQNSWPAWTPRSSSTPPAGTRCLRSS